jgi:hypothetical protein
MGFLKKLTGILGFGHNDGGGGHGAVRDEDGDGGDNNTGTVSGDGDKRREENQTRFRETGPRKGFGVPVQVAVERSNPGPILQPCAALDGGVQVSFPF